MSAVLRSPPRVPGTGAVVGWCLAVFLIAAAVLPMIPPLTSAGAPLVLEVTGEFAHVKPAEVRAALTVPLHGDFYHLDLHAVRAAVEALPWVAAARVERAWPATVRVHVAEHRPFARWNEDALLSDAGAVFIPGPGDASSGLPARALFAELPRLGGPAGQQAEVRDAFVALREQLAGTPFAPAGLRRDARGEWTAVTAQGIELKLGRGTSPAMVARAVASLGGPVRMALEGRLQEVAYVDLHYINGFAVGWREQRAGRVAGAGPGAARGND